jgi:hypothetical protein
VQTNGILGSCDPTLPQQHPIGREFFFLPVVESGDQIFFFQRGFFFSLDIENA